MGSGGLGGRTREGGDGGLCFSLWALPHTPGATGKGCCSLSLGLFSPGRHPLRGSGLTAQVGPGELSAGRVFPREPGRPALSTSSRDQGSVVKSGGHRCLHPQGIQRDWESQGKAGGRDGGRRWLSRCHALPPAQAEQELRVAQTEFDRQAEVTRLLLEGISSTHVSQPGALLMAPTSGSAQTFLKRCRRVALAQS